MQWSSREGLFEEVTLVTEAKLPLETWNQASVTEGAKLEGCKGSRKASWKTQTGLW